MRIEGSSFIVTGGASGLGGATARRLVALGGKVVIADLNEALGQQLAAELGDHARFCKVNVTSEADAQAAVALAQSAFGGLHGLINCAGIATGDRVVGKTGPHSLEGFARTIQINLIGSFNMLRLAADAMAKQEPNEGGERGVIINTASVAAFDGQIGQAAYSASKAGVVGMTLPIARELARFGIRIMTIAPGIFETAMMAGMAPNVRASLEATVPFPARLGRPEEYAQLVQQIVENAMLNGETIRLDGAIRMAPK
ncbi:3-hydroxyacyl-CoA dehydrogenase [Stagnimonas aquatica]|uniref:3-hydroxyacyl-CoA dehydrogenase n=1 Tax=Stagnimonas aquatica TaxID=2689987 RepID=A0A3N0VGX5_9GAMM|nr:3-hydroxyacyl-CoA dehydrogenase [Stagnimonas aquatica]ROH91931.1 3-hydroxyacyl-CoA dehydrogenase [Stagnimonas aquatica]